MSYGVWDIETEGVGGDFVILGWYDGQEYHDGDFLDLANFVENSQVKTWFAHYGGKFDNLYLLDFLRKNGYKFSLEAINSFIMPTLNKKHFRDSYLLMPMSLKRLTHDFDTKHKKLDYDDYEEHKDTEKLRKYLKNDVLGLYEALEIFRNELKQTLNVEFNFSRFKTLPQISFYILNEIFDIKKDTRNYMSKAQEDYVRGAYYGGRVEVFKRKGEGPLYQYDFNSLYPYVMYKYPYPTGRFVQFEGKDAERVFFETDRLGVVTAKVKVPKNIYIPPLPYRNSKGKLLFPVGTWTRKYYTEELRRAVKDGVKVKILKGIFWENKKRIFANATKKLYTLKQESTGAKRLLAKLLLNSGYGKFGQKREKTKIMTEEEVIRREIPFWNKDYLFSKGLYIWKEKNYSNRLLNVIIAVAITANARYEELELLRRCGEKSYYGDTDCVITGEKLPDSMLHDTKLGKLKLEAYGNNGVFISPKLYAMMNYDTTKIKGKGIPKEILQELSYSDLVHVLDKTGKTRVKRINDNLSFKIENGAISFSMKKLTSFKEGLRRVDCRDKGAVSTYDFKKVIKDTYDKRRLVDNYGTLPLIIEE